MNKPSIEQQQALKEFIKDQADKVWIGLNIYKRKSFRVYPDMEKVITYGMMRDIDNGVYDDHKWTTDELIERYLS